MNYFDVFEIEKKFLLEKEDEQKIENKYLELQKANNNVEGVINLKSTIINEAYATLKNDASRAEYLLKLLNYDLNGFKMPQDLIEYIIEVREDITDSETEKEIQEKIADLIIELEEAVIELAEEFKLSLENKGNIHDLAISFMRFKALSEIIKKYKKSKI